MAKTATKKPVDGNMTLGGHVKELRNRIMVVALVFFAVVVYGITKAPTLVDMVTEIGRNCSVPYTFVAITPQEQLMTYFKVAIMAGVVFALPMALYQAWAFAKPGLKKSETNFFGLTLLMGLGLFCVGVAFAYNISLPFMLNFLITLEQGVTLVQSTISIAEYVNFVLTIFIIFGCVFEIPLVTVILAKLGIASPQIMKAGRGIAIVLCFVLAAIITPPDVVSQSMVAVPMILLYELSILLARIFYKKRAVEDEDEEAEE